MIFRATSLSSKGIFISLRSVLSSEGSKRVEFSLSEYSLMTFRFDATIGLFEAMYSISFL